MLHKIKWQYISQKARDVVFEDLELFNKRKIDGVKDKNVLERLFNYYNEYVTFKYPKVGSSLSCGHCVNHVKGFFQREYDKCQRKEN
mgnify:CR=1 FL=1